MTFWENLGNIVGLIWVLGSWVVGAIVAFFILKLIWDETRSDKKEKKRIKLDEKEKKEFLKWKEDKKNE